MWTAFNKLRLALLICLTVMPALIVTAQDDSGEISIENDVLVYSIYDYTDGASLVFYDPSTEERTTLYQSSYSISFALAPDGRVALATRDEQILLFDTAFPDQPPVSLEETAGSYNIPVSWSPDSHYFVFTSFNLGEPSMFIWDGEMISEVILTDFASPPRQFSNMTWSNDGWLAFTAWFDISGVGYRGEVYFWDGQDVINLSQNQDGEDRSPIWNDAGELAFVSERTDDYDILVWDGVSMRAGLPDADTFTNIAPELTGNHSLPVWTPDGNIAFTAQSEDDTQDQIYLWDGETATNISQNPDADNTTPEWNADGLWAFSTFLSSEQLLYVRDANNQTLLATEGFGHAWSNDGNLIYCNSVDEGVYMWDGETVRQIISEWEIWAQWQSGERLICSNG